VSLLAIAGCGVPPLQLNPRPGSVSTTGKIDRIIDKVVCELSLVNGEEKQALANYVAVAQVTIKVEDSGGLTPSLSIINPLPVAGTSNSVSAGGEVSRGRLRSFTQNFVVNPGLLTSEDKCDENPGSSLTGDLGLREVVTAGLRATRRVGTNPGSLKAQDSHFGSTIQFSSKIGLNGGPGVARTNFKGYGGAAGLANMSRTGTDVLTIAFAPITAKAPGPLLLFELQGLTEDQKAARLRERAEEDAEAAARALLNRMLLENLELFQP
jgi:hypothetical protein